MRERKQKNMGKKRKKRTHKDGWFEWWWSLGPIDRIAWDLATDMADSDFVAQCLYEEIRTRLIEDEEAEEERRIKEKPPEHDEELPF